MSEKSEKPEERTFVTDDRKLVVEKHDGGNAYRVFVRPEETSYDTTLVETTDDEFAHVEALQRLASASDKDRLVIAPKAEGIWEIWAVYDAKAREPVAVEFHATPSPDEHAQIDRLFRVLGNEDLTEDEEESPIDADDRDRALVLPAGMRTKKPGEPDSGPADVMPSQLLVTLREIETLVDGRPGDPGRTMRLVDRVRDVLDRAERKGADR